MQATTATTFKLERIPITPLPGAAIPRTSHRRQSTRITRRAYNQRRPAMRTLITHGTIVTARETFKADVLVDGEQITDIAGSLDVPADRRIDASGKLVLPGAVDVHTHLGL